MVHGKTVGSLGLNDWDSIGTEERLRRIMDNGCHELDCVNCPLVSLSAGCDESTRGTARAVLSLAYRIIREQKAKEREGSDNEINKKL